MREILFKAKRKDNNEWVYGYVVIDKVGCSDNETGKDIYYIAGNSDMYFEIIPETICEYTGLKDKNGVKIFENDIVKSVYKLDDNKFIENIDTVEWNEEECSFMLGKGKRHFHNRLELEVIGNIFDKEV